ncbi:hypothetical protein JCM12296A_24390 [Desulfosarcina cetonica]
MTITGSVRNFVKVQPSFARLVGPVGSEIKKAITITREKAFPFRIVDVKARNGKDIAFDLKELQAPEGDGYRLTVENKKTAAGRYADTLILTTDSTIKPTINVPIYGQITAAKPAQAPALPRANTKGS